MALSETVAHIKPDVLRWARESAGYSTRRAADEIGVDKWYLEMVEDGDDLFSLDEAEKAADVYGRPLAALFLAHSPEEEAQEVQFRRLPGAPRPPWGPEVQLTARSVIERQQVAMDIYEALQQAPPWMAMSERFLDVPTESLPRVARAALGVSREEQLGWTQDDFASFRGWRTAVERLGVLVMQAGPVPVEEMRGFASIEPPDIPTIFVNNNDDPGARTFTVLHELGHVILARRGEPVGSSTERWCESFAGQVLMPADWLSEEFASAASRSTLGRVETVARTFHVTPLAAAVRLRRAGLITPDVGSAVISHIQGRWEGPEEEDEKPTGGNYYINQVNRFGPAYLGLVFTALDNEAMTLPTASAVLDGVKIKYFAKLRDELARRS